MGYDQGVWGEKSPLKGQQYSSFLYGQHLNSTLAQIINPFNSHSGQVIDPQVQVFVKPDKSSDAIEKQVFKKIY